MLASLATFALLVPFVSPVLQLNGCPGVDVEVLLSTEPGSPVNSAVGMSGPFAPTSTFRGMEVSADGSHYAAHGDDSNWDFVVVRDGSVVLAEGDSGSWSSTAGEGAGLVYARMGGINSSGEMAIQIRSDGPSDADEYVLRIAVDGSVEAAAAQKQPIPPGFSEDIGQTWGSFHSPGITDAGEVAFVASGGSGGPSEKFVIGQQVIAVKGDQNAIPLTPTSENGPIADFEGSQTVVDALGNWASTMELVTTPTGGPDGEVFVVNSAVVLQSSEPAPGGVSLTNNSNIYGGRIGTGGTWICEARDGITEFIFTAAGPVAESGAELFPGAGEFWSTSFQPFEGFDINASGEYVVAGETDQSPLVILYGNSSGEARVIARQGDFLDVDLDGSFAENRVIRDLSSPYLTIDDLGRTWACLRVRDDLGNAKGGAFVRITPAPACCPFEAFGETSSTINSLTLIGGGSTNLGGTVNLTTSGVSSGPTLTLFSLAPSEVPAVGGVAWIDLSQLIPLPGAATSTGGSSNLGVLVPIDANLIGKSVYAQSVAAGPGTPEGLALSNGLKVTICQ